MSKAEAELLDAMRAKEEKAAIRVAFANGAIRADLARQYGVTWQAVHDFLKGGRKRSVVAGIEERVRV